MVEWAGLEWQRGIESCLQISSASWLQHRRESAANGGLVEWAGLEWGSEVSKAVSRHPQLFGYSIGENLQPTVDWLKSLGLSGSEVSKAVSRFPQLFGCSIGENLQPKVDWLTGLGLTSSEVAKAVSTYPQFFSCSSVSKSFEPMVSWLVCMGANRLEIKHLVLRFPVIISLSLSKNLETQDAASAAILLARGGLIALRGRSPHLQLQCLAFARTPGCARRQRAAGKVFCCTAHDGVKLRICLWGANLQMPAVAKAPIS